MRNNWTKPHHNRPCEEMIFNCCLFRMIGTIEFADHHGWVTDWDPVFTKEVIKMRLEIKLVDLKITDMMRFKTNDKI